MYDKLLSQGVPLESHPSKLVGSTDSKNRYFDFEKLAEVCSNPICPRLLVLIYVNICSDAFLILPGYLNCYLQSQQNY